MGNKKGPIGWLDKSFFEKVLGQAKNDKSLTVKDFFINRHVSASEQFSSTLYRAIVSYRSKDRLEQIAFVIKLTSSKTNRLDDVASFENEANLYKDTIRRMQSLFKTSGEANVQLAPELVFVSVDPQPMIILEDVSSKKYELHKGLMNLTNSMLVARKLAIFHASSYSLLNDTKNKNPINVSNGLFNGTANDGVKFMEQNFVIFVEEISKWSGFEKYAENFKKLIPSFWPLGLDIFKQDNRAFATTVLNHGDFHYNNMLVQFDSSRTCVSDILFIDFQLSFYGTPAVDLIYFLYLVCDRETRDNHRQELIYHYHLALVETLTKIGFLGKIPTLLDLNCDLLRCGFLEVIISVCFMPFLFADYNAIQNVFSSAQNATEYRRQLYNNPQYGKLIEGLLPYFLHKGFIC
ncbi:uncharacterized protein LOC129779011 [Toxorhynchites rutilus septentrionalis]|uniref:uncharacterized protein LOC129779011 n=1 Tax=Toxorhynchites rutilus septentrionalis TaxID=329112 RepID=UPI002478DCEF|nr:uncharacterized protein LOC129779011 [Toxorhynchites rutilus septentrionalis]